MSFNEQEQQQQAAQPTLARSPTNLSVSQVSAGVGCVGLSFH